MCISITEADAIRISMHSQRYDTYEAASDAIQFTPVTMQCDSISIRFTQCDLMQYDAMEKKKAVLFTLTKHEFRASVLENVR